MKISDYATGIQHFGIPTKDMAKTVSFYQELGFETALSTYLEDTKQNVNFLKLGNLVVEIYDSKDAAMCYGGIEHVAIDVTDIQKVFDMICEKNLNTLNDEIHFLPFWDNGVKFFTIEGPNKEKVEFSQYL
jgi:catechol 2,3-dioxygenase-like lactoylglutathione lyase family enzyme